VLRDRRPHVLPRGRLRGRSRPKPALPGESGPTPAPPNPDPRADPCALGPPPAPPATTQPLIGATGVVSPGSRGTCGGRSIQTVWQPRRIDPEQAYAQRGPASLRPMDASASESNSAKRLHDEITTLEQQLYNSFEKDVGHELELADQAVTFLIGVSSSARERDIETDADVVGVPIGDVKSIKLFALRVMGLRAFRVIRASRAMLAFGYEPESRANDRILVELQTHRNAILSDPTGTEAVAWLKGERGRGIGRRTEELWRDGVYAHLSMDSHGDPRPIGRLANLETGEIDGRPRRTLATRISLLTHARFAYDLAVFVARLAGVEVAVEVLDEAIRAGTVRVRIAADQEH
jgi:hypothetical protein